MIFNDDDGRKFAIIIGTISDQKILQITLEIKKNTFQSLSITTFVSYYSEVLSEYAKTSRGSEKK